MSDPASQHFLSVQYVHCTTVVCDYSHWLDAVNYHGAECPNCGGVMEYNSTYEHNPTTKKARVIHRADKPPEGSR